MGKYVGINALNNLIANIKAKFAEKEHLHSISEVFGLEDRLNDITPLPDIETSEDVVLKLTQLNNIVNKLIPAIGEIYITTSEENPSLRFGGTWEQIKDTFLLASGDIYNAGAIGGEATHTLTVEEIPTQNHLFQRHMLDRNDDGINTGQSGYGVTNKTIDIYETTTENTGGGQPHNNMPPYLAVYVWKRVA